MQLGTKENTNSDREFRDAFAAVQNLLLTKYAWDERLSGRFSVNLIIGLVDRVLNNKNIGRIIEEILYLEGCLDRKTITKAESKFNHGLLDWLYHKHYNAADMKSLYFNLVEPLKTKTGERRFAEAFKSTQNQFERNNWDNLKAAKYLTNQVFIKQLKNLEYQKKVTGEWIVYHKHNGGNYYLAIAEHINDGDINYKNEKYEILAKQIQSFCSLEFPEFSGGVPLFR